MRHIPPGLLGPLEDSELSELSSSSDSEESSLPSLQVSSISEPVSNNSARRDISGPDRVFNQPSESEFVITDHVPMSRQERADDSVAQICDAIRSMAVQENPRSKLVVSFPVFRGVREVPGSVPGFSTNFCWALLALARGAETLELSRKRRWRCDANMSCICFDLQLLLLPLVLTPTN